jgi:hypothetical protein
LDWITLCTAQHLSLMSSTSIRCPSRPLVNNEESGDDLSVQNIPAALGRRHPSATSVSTNSASATSTSATLSTSGTQDTSAITRESIQRRQSLGGFVWDTNNRTGQIRDTLM